MLLSGRLIHFSFLSISYFISNRGNQGHGVVYKGLLTLKLCHLLIQSFHIAASGYMYFCMITWEKPQLFVTYNSSKLMIAAFLEFLPHVKSMLSTSLSVINEMRPYSFFGGGGGHNSRMQNLSHKGSNTRPLQWKHGVLTTGSPEKSETIILWYQF